MNLNKRKVYNSEKLDSVSHLSSALAHEIRNPLTVVKGFLQLISTNDFNDETKREFALIAISEIDRAENIIRDFLTYAKPKVEEIENIYLDEEIKKVIKILQPFANLNAVRILFDYSDYSLIRGESSLIQQCLVNICKNAIEAMDNGGILSIQTSRDPNNLNVEIKDTGVGMSEEQLIKLGKPFFSTKGDKGTGLGLFATYSILNKLNAKIKVTSKQDVGTIFLLSFPLIEKVNQGNTIKNEELSSQKEKVFN